MFSASSLPFSSPERRSISFWLELEEGFVRELSSKDEEDWELFSSAVALRELSAPISLVSELAPGPMDELEGAGFFCAEESLFPCDSD